MPSYTVLHDIPGRLRIQVPLLRNYSSFDVIERYYCAIKGIEQVRIEPAIMTMVIIYNTQKISKREIFQFIALFFQQRNWDPVQSIFINSTPGIRKAIVRSAVTGLMLLVAVIKKRYTRKIDVFDYLVVISTAHTVLSHGESDRYRHPDILTGIISLFSLGASNLLHVCIVTWAVNVLEILHDIKRANHRPIQ
ncbi:HMA2 domain-containing protein [Niallia endozanthoxylica]|uniref:Uncharacterized protein n=1 Tax=Niallia endozanthoxylica TaxID=2036016 RepID=A0A5J5I3L3_9BACI|nr:hypothetical protein [Niallia endozanthoxylica]KAA9030618.1 hypothetical protein F4V44_02145 [Niallia endozanthoxylica]